MDERASAQRDHSRWVGSARADTFWACVGWHLYGRWWPCTWERPCTPPLRRSGESAYHDVMHNVFGLGWPPREFLSCGCGRVRSRERVDWECEELIEEAARAWPSTH